MVSAYPMQTLFTSPPVSVDTQAQKLFEDEDAILDETILDQSAMDSSLDMSPPMGGSRRDPFDTPSTFLSPKTEGWTVEMPSVPSNNPFGSNNPFMQPQNFSAPPPQSWPMSNTMSNASTACAAFDGLPTDFDQRASLFRGPMQGHTPFGNPAAQMPLFSPVNGADPSMPTSPANVGKKMRPSSPPIRSHNDLRRGDGIRKKNARFDIPAERTLSNIDQLIAQSSDDQEIKELKQQKRLLRNRQAALDSRQRKKLHTERLEDEKKQFTALITDMEDEMSELKAQMEQMMLKEQQYEEFISEMTREKEDMVRTHTLETGELRKKVSVLTDHVQRLEAQQPPAPAPTANDFNNFSEMDGMAMDTSWNMGFLPDFGMENQLKEVVPAKKEPEAEKPTAQQGGLLFMLFLVGAFVLSNNRGSSPQIPRVSEDVREASATLLDNIFKEAGVNQAGAVVEMAPQPSVTGAGAAAPSWSATPSAPVATGMDSLGPSMLGDLADSLTQPTEAQNNEQLFGLSAAQYNSITSQEFLQTPAERTTSQGRQNLAEALAAIRTTSKSSADVYTRSLLFDQIPQDVVRNFAKLVSDARSSSSVEG